MTVMTAVGGVSGGVTEPVAVAMTEFMGAEVVVMDRSVDVGVEESDEEDADDLVSEEREETNDAGVNRQNDRYS